MINSEEDAENAFQLSSALTQALLDFRMKSLDSVSPWLWCSLICLPVGGLVYVHAGREVDL